MSHRQIHFHLQATFSLALSMSLVECKECVFFIFSTLWHSYSSGLSHSHLPRHPIQRFAASLDYTGKGSPCSRVLGSLIYKGFPLLSPFTMRLNLIEVIRLKSNLSEGYTDYSMLPIEISCNPINPPVSSLGIDSLALNHYVIFPPWIPLSAPVTASRFWDTDVPYSSFLSGARITDNLPSHWVRA